MHIEKFVHSSNRKQNRDLFSLIGEFGACDATRNALGGTISSRPGQVWYVAVKEQTVYAFGSIRVRGTKGLLRHLYSPVDDDVLRETVLHHCVEHARRNHVRSVWLTDYLTLEGRYAPLGFVPYGNPRGRFIQYVLYLEALYGN